MLTVLRAAMYLTTLRVNILSATMNGHSSKVKRSIVIPSKPDDTSFLSNFDSEGLYPPV